MTETIETAEDPDTEDESTAEDPSEEDMNEEVEKGQVGETPIAKNTPAGVCLGQTPAGLLKQDEAMTPKDS